VKAGDKHCTALYPRRWNSSGRYRFISEFSLNTGRIHRARLTRAKTIRQQFLLVFMVLGNELRDYIRFEAFTAVTMKNFVFRDVAPCRSCVIRRFGGTYFLHLQDRKIREQTAATCSRWFLVRGYFYSEDGVDTQIAAICSRWFLARRFFYREDGGDTFLRNVGSHKIFTAPHPRRPHSSN
jgi:hypothetical protein